MSVWATVWVMGLTGSGGGDLDLKTLGGQGTGTEDREGKRKKNRARQGNARDPARREGYGR